MPAHPQQRRQIVRNPVRKFMGMALMGVLGALVALPMLAAGAQTNGSTGTDGVPPAPPGCFGSRRRSSPPRSTAPDGPR